MQPSAEKPNQAYNVLGAPHTQSMDRCSFIVEHYRINVNNGVCLFLLRNTVCTYFKVHHYTTNVICRHTEVLTSVEISSSTVAE